MAETPVSLLERLRLRPNDEAWKQLVDLYGPLLRAWLRRYFVQPADADDVFQNVFKVVVAQIPNFKHNRQTGAFRSWLRQIMVHSVSEFRRREAKGVTADPQASRALDQLANPNSELTHSWDQEHSEHIARYFLQQIAGKFEPATCAAFRGVVLDGKKPNVVARELGMSANAVRLAKYHVLHWLRDISEGLVD
jgi:RNA polymerase sigma-70 factor, ECF subfamily